VLDVGAALPIGVVSAVPAGGGARSVVTISCSTTAPVFAGGSGASRYRRLPAAFAARWLPGSSVICVGSSSTALPSGVITRARIIGLSWYDGRHAA